MRVNNHPLPSYLIELIKLGRWKTPDDIQILSEITGVEKPADFSFLSVDGMQRETEGGHSIVKRGEGKYYGIYSSKDSTEVNQFTDFLDIANSIIIAINWDEEVICLDYRENLNDPTVVLSVYPETSEGTVHWKQLAKSFIEFADKLKL